MSTPSLNAFVTAETNISSNFICSHTFATFNSILICLLWSRALNADTVFFSLLLHLNLPRKSTESGSKCEYTKYINKAHTARNKASFVITGLKCKNAQNHNFYDTTHKNTNTHSPLGLLLTGLFVGQQRESRFFFHNRWECTCFVSKMIPTITTVYV